MIPASGFYGIVCCPHVSMSARDIERLEAGGLPAPCLAGAQRVLGVWQGASLEAAQATEAGHWLVFLGVLHNRHELLTQLGLPAETPTARLLLQAWLRWPDTWTHRLDGLYALAHWADNGRDLTLHRDASGALGLFYGRTESDCLAFSSHLGTLLRLPGMRRRLARKGLHEYLRLLDIAAPNTLFEGVRTLPAGEGVVLDMQRPGVERVVSAPSYPVVDVPFDEAVAELESRLTAGIERRLDGLARPAAFLSGGVDSALICALAAGPRPDLEAITVGFDGAAYDETPIAHSVATHLGLRHRTLRFGREALLHALADAGRHAEQPSADPAGLATLLAFEHCKHHYDGVLDGTGADELAGTMPPRHVRVAVAYTSRLPAPLRRQLAAGLLRLPGLAGYAPLFDFEHPAETMMRWHGFRRQEIEALCGEPVSLAHTRFHEVFARFPRTDHFARTSALTEAQPSDRLSQAALISGLDVRFPYWDPSVEALLRSLPVPHRWRQDAPKHILRAVLARHVPRPLWDFPKHGFDFPLREFLCAEDFLLLRRYLLDNQWEQWQALAPEQVRSYASRFMAGETRLLFRVWALVTLAAWLEGHPA